MPSDDKSDSSKSKQIVPYYADSIAEIVEDDDARTKGDNGQERMMRGSGAGKLAYIVGELLQKAREGLVPDPNNPIYQLSRKVGDKVLPESKHWPDEVLKEAAGIGLYLFLDKMLGGGPYKK